MIEALTFEQALRWFDALPRERRIATLSPAYVVADAARDPTLHPLFLGYRDSAGQWLHGVHQARVATTSNWDFQSPYGYGGPVADQDAPDFLARAWSAYLRWCQEHDILAEFVRLHPLAHHWQPYGGQIRDDRSTVAIDVRDAYYRARYEIRCRTAVRKAEKSGLRVERRPSSQIVSQFAAFYRTGMQAIGAAPFYLFDDRYFAALSELPGIELQVCLQQDEWRAAALFLSGAHAMEYHLSATDDTGRRLSATNLLIDAAARRAHELGLDWLYLGGGTDARSDNPLLRFKAGFSAVRLPFRHGFTIHHPARYDALLDAFGIDRSARHRVLFYR